MTPEVARHIDAYTPRRVNAEAWEAVADLVRDRVRAAQPTSKEMSLRLLTPAAHMAAWAHCQGIPHEAVFSEETVERYVRQMDGTDGSRATMRCRLRRLVPDKASDRIREITRRSVRPPYTPSELAGLWRLACNQPSELRRNRLRALIALSAGAGCSSTDLRHVTNASVVDDPEGPTWVEIGGSNPRRVPVLAGFDKELVDVAKKVDGPLVVAPEDGKNAISALTRNLAGGEDLPALHVSRLRSTWMACLMAAWVPLSEITRLAGVKTIKVLEDLLPYCKHFAPEADTDHAAEAVRNAWRPKWL